MMALFACLFHRLGLLGRTDRSGPGVLGKLGVILAALGVFACGPSPADAAFTMSIGDYRTTSATTGTFEVTLSNTDTTTYNVAGFNFELMLPTSSGVRFSGASTATVAHPYIFLGTGSATVDPGFQLSYNSFPNTDFNASDTEFTFSSIAVTPGSSFSLGLISYVISPNAPSSTVPINFVSIGTGLSDADGNAISFTTRGGSIQVNSVPEPASIFLLANSIAIIVASRRFVLRRRSSGTLTL